MEALSRLLRAGTHIFEAEGRLLKREIIGLLLTAGTGLVVILLVMGGLGLLFFSFFSLLARPLTPAGAAATLGVVHTFAGVGWIHLAESIRKGRTFLSSPRTNRRFCAIQIRIGWGSGVVYSAVDTEKKTLHVLLRLPPPWAPWWR